MVRDTVLNRLSKLRMLGASSKFALTLPKRRSTALFRRHFVGRNIKTEHFDLLPIYNERLLEYNSGSDERAKVKAALTEILNQIEQVPIVINGKEIYGTGDLVQILPYNLNHYIARYSHAKRQTIKRAIKKSLRAQEKWNKTKLSERIAIWEAAGQLIADKYRYKIVAATMLGQGKTLGQAEMDVAELVDYMRINPIFLRDLANYEPVNDRPAACRNHMILRGLSGFVAAISPFNYTSIAANLAYAPALMGNVVLWKPSDSAILSNWYVFQAMREAGVPDGVVNFIPACPTTFAKVVTGSPKLAGINFTGTGIVLKVLWQMVGEKINTYENYPRLVGDSGGKNFHFVHSSANPDTVVACTIRAAFEYAGQKCSSCSMLYVPESLWEKSIKKSMLNIVRKLFISEATYCDCFYSAVINRNAYDRIFVCLTYIHNNPDCKVLIGGTCSKLMGYYVDPTIVLVNDLDNILCKEEMLAPILCVHVYKDKDLNKTMAKVAEINHGLTASIFANDNGFIKDACESFRFNVGTLNVNDKCTGSKVAQQPFGAGHMTGTSDKLGSPQYLLRWTSPQVIKESFKSHVNIFYPHMEINENAQITRTQPNDEANIS